MPNRWFEKGYQKGFKEGFEEGRKEGLEEGRRQAREELMGHLRPSGYPPDSLRHSEHRGPPASR